MASLLGSFTQLMTPDTIESSAVPSVSTPIRRRKASTSSVPWFSAASREKARPSAAWIRSCECCPRMREPDCLAKC